MAMDSDLYVCLCYVTPDDSSRQSLNETNIFDRLLESVVSIDSKSENISNLLICGDFNGRTSNNADSLKTMVPFICLSYLMSIHLTVICSVVPKI